MKITKLLVNEYIFSKVIYLEVVYHHQEKSQTLALFRVQAYFYHNLNQ